MDEGSIAILVAVVAIFVLVGGILIFIRQKTLKDSWEGIIQDKTITTSTDAEGDTSEWYYLHVQLGNGQVVKKRVDKKVYERLNIGDRAMKVAGQMEPTKVS